LPLVIGIDGCKAGWFAVWHSQDETIETAIFPSISNLKDFFVEFNQFIIGIDMPVILSEVMPREADQLARKLLSKKASSVFTAPTPKMLDQPNYEKACLISKNLIGKSMSLQSWYLFPKIKDVQTILHYKNIKVFEIHPELSFRAMNNQKVILESKKTNEGFEIRKSLLDKHFLDFNFDVIRNKYQKKDVMDDDILDALVVLWSAKRIVNNQALYLPKIPEKQNMQIVY